MYGDPKQQIMVLFLSLWSISTDHLFRVQNTIPCRHLSTRGPLANNDDFIFGLLLCKVVNLSVEINVRFTIIFLEISAIVFQCNAERSR